MNRFEKIIYSIVKKNPKLKSTLRDIYQSIFSLIPKKVFESKYPVVVREGHFFGFHDKIPWSFDGSKLLSHRYNLNNSNASNVDSVEVGYFDRDGFGEFNVLSTTKSWNWQQGSMLQWIGKSDNFIFNCWNGNSNIARIMDCSGKLVMDLPGAVGAVSYNGKNAVGYSFERLNIGMVGYGYSNENDCYKNVSLPSIDGLFIYNIETGTKKLLFSLEEISKVNFEETMLDAYHFFTHCLFSPNDKRFLFLHRWYIPNKRNFTRMISCDIDGQNIHIFPTNGMVSHITWVGSDKVLAYSSTANFGDGYHLFNDQVDSYSLIGASEFSSDGHPQYNVSSKKVVTDTYPNRCRIQELSIFDIGSGAKDVVGKFYSPGKFKESFRCDLHPRWNHSGDLICFDSSHTGCRSMCIMTLKAS